MSEKAETTTLTRVIQLVADLQAGNCTVKELARAHRVTCRTIERDFKRMRMGGVRISYTNTRGRWAYALKAKA